MDDGHRKIFSKLTPKLSGISGILAPSIGSLMISLTILLHPDFQWADYALSDLGAVGTSYNYLFNFGLIVAAIFGILFTINLWRLRNTFLGLVGELTFFLGFLFLILIGVFPSGTAPHGVVSYGFFILCTVGLVVLGIDQLFASSWIWGAYVLSLVASGLSSLLLVNTIPYPLGAAIPEVIGVVAFGQFSIVYGIRLLYKRV